MSCERVLRSGRGVNCLSFNRNDSTYPGNLRHLLEPPARGSQRDSNGSRKFDSMRTDLETEKKAIQRVWSKRQAQIERVTNSSSWKASVLRPSDVPGALARKAPTRRVSPAAVVIRSSGHPKETPGCLFSREALWLPHFPAGISGKRSGSRVSRTGSYGHLTFNSLHCKTHPFQNSSRNPNW